MALIASNASLILFRCVYWIIQIDFSCTQDGRGSYTTRAGRLQGSVSHRLPGLWRRASHGKRMETIALNDTYIMYMFFFFLYIILFYILYILYYIICYNIIYHIFYYIIIVYHILYSITRYIILYIIYNI